MHARGFMRAIPMVCIFSISAHVIEGRACRLGTNPFLKNEINAEILRLAQTRIADGTKAAQLLLYVQELVPLINRLSIKKDMYGLSYIQLSFDRPWLVLICSGKTPLVVSKRGDCVPAHYVRDDIIADLTLIRIKQDQYPETEIKKIAQWAQRQPPTFFEACDVEWTDKNNVIIHEKNDPEKTIRAGENTAFDQKLTRILARIKSLEEEKGEPFAAIDLRFDGQVILTPKSLRGKRG